MSVQNIFYQTSLIAQKFKINEVSESIFPTPNTCEFQFGVGVVKETKFFKPHIHKNAKRNISNTSEFIYVVNGKMTIEILSPSEEFVETVTINENEGFLQFFGGHKIVASENTRYFEIKQGPYNGQDFDKRLIDEDSSK
tara:strand:+ start:8110 stop:8526 length:417 start_codon:yes stop_codon:yes gene_type:complete